MKNIKELAVKIAERLFTDGSGSVAKRLVMEMPGAQLVGSGWCKEAVADQVLAILANPSDEIVPRKHIREIEFRRPPARGRVPLFMSLGITDQRCREIDDAVSILISKGGGTAHIINECNKSGVFNDAEWAVLLYGLGMRDNERRHQREG